MMSTPSTLGRQPSGLIDFHQAIGEIGSPKDYAEVCATFLDDLPKALADVEKARHAPLAAALRLIHEAATTTGILGARALSRDLRKLEAAARAGTVADPQILLDRTAQALSQVAASVRAHLRASARVEVLRG